MFQFTLKQLLLAMACFSIAFAGFVMSSSHGDGLGRLAGWFLVAIGIVSGIGAILGCFWKCVALAIFVPIALLALNFLETVLHRIY